MKIYVASKVRHARKWRELRAAGLPINSTWIDKTEEPLEEEEFNDLWAGCIRQVADADVLLLYQEAGEHLKGALIELGVALAHRKRVVAVGIDNLTIFHYNGIDDGLTLENALRMIRAMDIEEAKPRVAAHKDTLG